MGRYCGETKFSNVTEPYEQPAHETAVLYFRQSSTRMSAIPNPACKHQRTQVIAKDNEAQYVECLDCGEILEAAEMEKKETPGFDESLSDA
jgi:hypothetical protein